MHQDRYDDIGALINEAASEEGGGRPERTEYVPLRGRLQGDIDDLRQQLADVQRPGGDSMEADPRVAEIKAQIEDLTTQLRDSVRPFRLRALPRPEFRALVDEHPPRRVVGEDGVERPDLRDGGSEFNIDTFYPALIRKSIIKPELTEGQLDQLLNVVLTDAYYTKLALAALFLNRRELNVPFSQPASPSSPSSDGGSKQPAGSGSR